MRKRLVFFISIFLYLSKPGWADPQGLFLKAQEHYKKGEYKEAIEQYESIVQQGVSNENVFYNLGNSYYKDNQVGKAILNYKRAQLYSPRDHDLNANLNLAIAQAQVPQVANKNIIEDFLVRLSSSWTFNELFIMVVTVYILVGCLFLWGMLKRLKSKLSYALWIPNVIILIFLGSILVAKTTYYSSLAIVTKDEASKFEPNKNSTTHFGVPQGSIVKIQSVEDDWVKIKRLDGKRGWVPQQSVESILPPKF